MKFEFEPTHGMSDNDFGTLETLTKLKISPELKQFLSLYAGSTKPENSNKNYIVKITHEDGWIDEHFIVKVETAESIQNLWQFRDYLEDFAESFNLTKSYVETTYLFPFIELSGGEAYMALAGQHAGKIYVADNGDFGIIKIAHSLDEFINQLVLA